MIEQAKFTCSSLEKAFKKLIKTTEDQEKKQINVIMNKRKRQVGLINHDTIYLWMKKKKRIL